jgi:ribosomal protein S18 acetylase RimI-like enzyme
VIATAAHLRRAGVGTALLDALRRAVPAGAPIVAETDRNGVGFYAATGFTVTSLGEKYPGAERFSVRDSPRST